MLDLVASIYRTLIYEYLSIKYLVRLSKTCKTINNDPNIKEMIIKKIINKFGYNISHKFWNTYLYNIMDENMITKLLVGFKNRTLSVNFNQIENLSFEDKRNLQIKIPTYLFFKLEKNEQEEIIYILCDQLYKLYEYANKNKMDMAIYEYRCPEEFDLYPFNKNIQYKLKQIFIEGNDEIKCHIINQLSNMIDSCICNKFVNRINNNNLTPNVDDFINGIYDYNLSKLDISFATNLSSLSTNLYDIGNDLSVKFR
jgi:hypothetical protein